MARDLPDANVLPTIDMRPTGAVTQVQIADPTERIAQNTMRAAGDMQQFAGVIEKAKNEFDQTVALDAYGKAQNEAIQLEAGYKNVRGKDAASPEFYKKMSDQWGQKMGAIAESLNPDQQRLFQRQAQPLAMTFKAGLIGHINEQTRVFKISTNKGIIDQGLQLANGLTSTDDIATGQAIGTLNTARQSFDNLVSLGAIGSREEAKAAWQEYLDKFHSNRVLTVANDSALGGPVRAEALLKEIQKQNIKDMGISAHAFTTLNSSLRTRVDDQLSRSKATEIVTKATQNQQVNNDDAPDIVPGVKSQTMNFFSLMNSGLESADRYAEETRPGDAAFRNMVRDRVKSEISDMHTRQTLLERDNWRTIVPILYSTDGDAPGSMAALRQRMEQKIGAEKTNQMFANLPPDAVHTLNVALANNETRNEREVYSELLTPLRDPNTGRLKIHSEAQLISYINQNGEGGFAKKFKQLTGPQRETFMGHLREVFRQDDDTGNKANVAGVFDLINQGRITEQWQIDRYGLDRLGGFGNYSNLVRHLEEVRTGGNVQNRVAIERSVREATTAWNSLSNTSGIGKEMIPAAITDYRNEVIDRLAKVPAGNPEQRAASEKKIIDEVTKPEFYNKYRPDVVEAERKARVVASDLLEAIGPQAGKEVIPIGSTDKNVIERAKADRRPNQILILWDAKSRQYKPWGEVTVPANTTTNTPTVAPRRNISPAELVRLQNQRAE